MTRLEALTVDTSYLRLPEGDFWVRQAQAPLRAPRVVAWNEEAARLLGLDPGEGARPDLAALWNGEAPLPWATPAATAYAGHQFGVWVPRLGDGRALLLGEVVGPGGRRLEVQLKGAGRTPFSRQGDGRAVLRSAVRELLAGEALEALGIPSQRVLCVVGSETPVQRERLEQGALVVRLASTHVRVGTFEYFASLGRHDHVARLAEHVLAHDYPELATGPDRHARLLEAVAVRTAHLAAGWLAHGFVHGVLNTDNLSIAGFTLDHGPFAFVEAFDPGFCPNHTDPRGRYALDQQPQVCVWNLACLARALESLVPLEAAREALEAYAPAFAARYEDLMRARLGLVAWRGDEDDVLLQDLLEVLAGSGADYPATLRGLARLRADDATPARVTVGLPGARAFDAWAARYLARVAQDGLSPDERRRRMDAVNPRVVLRAHLAQRAVERAEAGDPAEVARLVAALRRPFDDDPALDAYAAPPPPGTTPPELSCSS